MIKVPKKQYSDDTKTQSIKKFLEWWPDYQELKKIMKWCIPSGTHIFALMDDLTDNHITNPNKIGRAHV